MVTEFNAMCAHQHVINMHHLHEDEIKHSIDNSYVLQLDDMSLWNPENCEQFDTKVFVTKEKSHEALFNNNLKDVAILNFASYKEPGGLFFEGCMTQEESLCHQSILYPVISSFQDYYAYNNKHKNRGLYLNRMIYSKDIIFAEDSEILGKADVITCAAPYTKVFVRYGGDVALAQSAMTDRIDFILYVATVAPVKNLILGAFGCGVFGNDPRYVASEFKRLLTTKYKGCFENVYFPIYGDSRNYDAFYNAFR